MRTRLLFTLLLACTPACDSGFEADDADLLGASDDGKADGVSSTSTYYTVAQDFRKCIYPLCGGLWVARVNFAQTKCVDGKYADRCYVAEHDLSALGLNETDASEFRYRLTSGHAIVRAKIAKTSIANYGTFGKFVVSEGWNAPTDAAATGIYYRLSDNGIQCFTYPCNSVHEAKLNSTVDREITGPDLINSGATEEQIADATNDLYTSALIVAGNHSTVKGPGGTGWRLDASQFFTRVRKSPPVEMSCGGFIGTPCENGSYCDITVENACKGADLPGVCKPASPICLQIYKPVCGCDGKTYSNDCTRLASRVQLAYSGPCN